MFLKVLSDARQIQYQWNIMFSKLRGRTYATPQDVFDLAPEILRHRLLLTYDALAQEITTDDVVNRMLAAVPAHWVSPKPNDAFSRS